MLPHSFFGARILVLGYGVSSRAVVHRLLFEGARGEDITVCTPTPVSDPPLSDVGVSFSPTPPKQADFIFRSPGIPPSKIPAIPGAVVTSECALFFARCPCPILGITGSDGKTTTATLTANILEEAGRRVYLGGNIGNSLLSALPHMRKEDLAVLELSSFQLADFVPTLAAGGITNLTENHLNWHKDMADYAAAKRHLAEGSARRVLSLDCAFTRSLAKEDSLLFSPTKKEADFPNGNPCLFAKGADICYRPPGDNGAIPLFPKIGVFAKSQHLLSDLLCAMGLTLPYADSAAMERAAEKFRGVAHRMQTVHTGEGIRFIDSSADTTPARTLTTLAALEKKPVVLLGGTGKGLSFASLAEALPRLSVAAVVYGEMGKEISLALRAQAVHYPVFEAESLKNAFSAGLHAAREKETDLLLSPACASFDEFTDYKERGEFFCRLAKEAYPPQP